MASPAPTSLADLPADVVLRIVALLPARVARLVSRAARDAADAAVESLELEWRSPSVRIDAFGSEEGPPYSLETFEALLKKRFAHLERLEFRDVHGISCATSFLQALCRREEGLAARGVRRPLRHLSVASGVSGSWAASVEAPLALALEALPRPLERLKLSLPSLALSEKVAGAIRSKACGLRELSLGHLGPRTVLPLSSAIGALTALERLELCVGVASSRPLWTALADVDGRLRLETLSLTGNSSLDADDTLELVGPAVAALPSLRSLTVDRLAPVVAAGSAAALLHLPALAALTHLAVLRHGVDAACLGQLTALRSLRAPRIGSSSDGPAGTAAALAALAALTSLTRLELFYNYDAMPMPPAAAPVGDGVMLMLPSLRLLQAGTLLPLLLLDPLLSLPSLTDLTCICLPLARSDAFERRLGQLLTGADGRRLTSLTIDGNRWDNGPLRIGRPSGLGALTILSSSARMLRPPPRAWLPWLPWPLSALWSCRGRGRGSGCSGCRLTHLTINFAFDDDDVAPMLRGVPALTTLGLLGLSHRNVRGQRALAAAFAELPSLTALNLSGYSMPMADVLGAAAACPALRAGLERIKVRWYEPEVMLTSRAGEALAAAVRPFAALRSVRMGTFYN